MAATRTAVRYENGEAIEEIELTLITQIQFEEYCQDKELTGVMSAILETYQILMAGSGFVVDKDYEDLILHEEEVGAIAFKLDDEWYMLPIVRSLSDSNARQKYDEDNENNNDNAVPSGIVPAPLLLNLPQISIPPHPQPQPHPQAPHPGSRTQSNVRKQCRSCGHVSSLAWRRGHHSTWDKCESPTCGLLRERGRAR